MLLKQLKQHDNWIPEVNAKTQMRKNDAKTHPEEISHYSKFTQHHWQHDKHNAYYAKFGS